MRVGVILYGPPASGKDTITRELCLQSRFTKFRLLKTGADKTGEYRMADRPQIAELAAQGEILWQAERYGSIYAIDKKGILDALDTGSIPVVQLGQPDGVTALTELETAEWHTLALWCPRLVAEKRLHARGTTNIDQRLEVWDKTQPLDADLTIDTHQTSPQTAAKIISDQIPQRG